MYSIIHYFDIHLGCTVEITEPKPLYDSVKTNNVLIDLYMKNAKSFGAEYVVDPKGILASTDMGNVSQIKPSIHPLFKITTTGANHTHEFTEATGSAENQLPTLNSAKSMALTAIEVACDENLLAKVKEDFLKN